MRLRDGAHRQFDPIANGELQSGALPSWTRVHGKVAWWVVRGPPSSLGSAWESFHQKVGQTLLGRPDHPPGDVFICRPEDHTAEEQRNLLTILHLRLAKRAGGLALGGVRKSRHAPSRRPMGSVPDPNFGSLSNERLLLLTDEHWAGRVGEPGRTDSQRDLSRSFSGPASTRDPCARRWGRRLSLELVHPRRPHGTPASLTAGAAVGGFGDHLLPARSVHWGHLPTGDSERHDRRHAIHERAGFPPS
jgi:hypothetical protein